MTNSLGIIFYILAGTTVVATFLAITRRNMIHAVVYLIISFITTALLFYLLGAPFVALLEIIIYAGGIMVLFLFIIIMIRVRTSSRRFGSALKQWWPAITLGVISVGLAGIMIAVEPAVRAPLKTAQAAPGTFGRFLFQAYWFPVEIASFLLLVALVGAFYLGRSDE